MSQLKVIGRVEKISFPELGVNDVYAKIDTGADISSIWATEIAEQDGSLKFKLFGKSSPCYTGEVLEVPASKFLLTRIANSFGHKELRYVVKLQVKIAGKKIRGTFTLSNRSRKTYPVLIGRKLLNKKFVVDVSQGTPLEKEEKKKKARMQEEIEVFKMWESK